MPIENPTESLDAFKGFLRDLREYRRLLNNPATRGNAEVMREELNRQYGVMVHDITELRVTRTMTITGSPFAIFETAIGPLPDDPGSMFIPIAALDMAITVTHQAIGMLERLEANKVRDAARVREDAKVLASASSERERGWLWLPIVIVLAGALGWLIRGYQASLWDLFGALNPQFVRWLIGSVVGTLVFMAGNYAINRLASDSEKSKTKIVVLVVVAFISGWIAFAIAVPPPPASEPVTLPNPSPAPPR